MMNSVAEIYQFVIDDVVLKVGAEFEHESVPDTILQELKRLWEEKLQNSGVLPTAMNTLMYQHNFTDPAGYRSRLPSNVVPATYLQGGPYNPIGMPWSKGPPQNDGTLDDFTDVTNLDNLTSLGEEEENQNTEEGEDFESLGSSLDDENEEPETEDIVLCQFEKVSRVRTKHKCQLKDGIMHLNGKDYVFNKASCEFEFYYN